MSLSSLPAEILIQIIQLLRKPQGDPIGEDYSLVSYAPARDYNLVPYALVSLSWSAVVLPMVWEDLVIQWGARSAREMERLLDVLWETSILENPSASPDPTAISTLDHSTTNGVSVSRVNHSYISYVKNLYLCVSCSPSMYDSNSTKSSAIRCLQYLHPAQLQSLQIIFYSGWINALLLEDMRCVLDAIVPATTQLSKLHIAHCPHALFVPLIQRLSPSLREIELIGIANFAPDQDFRSIITHLITLPGLRKVILPNSILFTSVDLICSARAWGPQLRQLRVNILGKDYSEGVRAIADNCPKLEFLCLYASPSPVGTAGRASPVPVSTADHVMCALIDKCPCLNFLKLRGSIKVSDSFLTHCISRAYQLKNLYIGGGVKLTGKGLSNMQGWTSLQRSDVCFGLTRVDQ